MKDIFKQKKVIISLVLAVVGCLALLVMNFIPHGGRYVDMKDIEIAGEGIKIVYTFKGKTLQKSYLYDDGTEDLISEGPYEIKKGVLYYENKEVGEIDFFYIYEYSMIVNNKKINTGYKCTLSVLLKYAMIGLIVAGGVLFVYTVYNNMKNKDDKGQTTTTETPS